MHSVWQPSGKGVDGLISEAAAAMHSSHLQCLTLAWNSIRSLQLGPILLSSMLDREPSQAQAQLASDEAY